MRTIYASLALAVILIAMPIAADAQANTSASVQQAFLSELQSLAQQLAALTSTINAMISASGGILPSDASSTPAVTVARIRVVFG